MSRFFAAVMADRADWDTGTRAQRHLVVAADTELRRRHPGQAFTPLRSAEPAPATPADRSELTMTPHPEVPEMGQWIKDLAARRDAFADYLGRRQSLTIPAPNLGHSDLGLAFPPWTSLADTPILQPPRPEIPPSPLILERAMDRDTDWEAAD